MPTADTGLADLGGLYAGTGDVFYFANKVGDTGTDNGGSYVITSADITQVRTHPGTGVPVDYLYDMNKDGSITSADLTILEYDGGSLAWIDVSSGGPLAPQSAAAGVSSGLAAVLVPRAATNTASADPPQTVAASSGELRAAYFASLASSSASLSGQTAAAFGDADSIRPEDDTLDALLADLGLQ